MNFPLSLPISGLYYHYKSDMPNSMNGYIKAEPDNKYDSQAIGIYNDFFGLIGYIPKDSTAIVRAWFHCESPLLKCQINLAVEPAYDRYYGGVLIYDTPDETYMNGPFKDKAVYLCKNGFSLSGPQLIAESFGANVVPRLSKATDFVVYDTELTDNVKNKIGVDGYQFETITLAEFIQRAIPEERRNPLIYGKTVTPSSSVGSVLDDYLHDYILIQGGNYKKTYSKTKTDVVILKRESSTQMSEKAATDGKSILYCKDLMPELYDVLVEQSPKESTITIELPKFSSATTSQHNDSSKQDVVETDENSSNRVASGCVFIIFLIAFIIYYLIK